MPVRLIAILSLLRLTAHAQAPVEDGVRAMFRGDYKAAAAIFRPLSQGPGSDPVAQFLLATLYDRGRGVDANRGNACTLFSDVGKSTHPLALPATEILESMRQEMGRGAMLLCSGAPLAEQTAGSFALGPGQRVDITATAIVVTYNGSERRIASGFPPGWVPLPTLYTPLDVTHPTAGRRHFLHTFAWWRDPNDNSSQWRLGWMLNEVVAGEYLPVTADPSIMTASGPQPPGGVDAARLVRVFVNSAGEVEWNVGSRDAPRRGLVPWRDPK